MKELHEALALLAPLDWPEEAITEEGALREMLAAGELAVNSVPIAEGTPFDAAVPGYRQPNQARSHKDITASEARPYPPHEEHEKLQKSWGKPYKFKPDVNPYNVALYKMAGHDRHGAWFARRSVHEGMGFDRFKRAMMIEFPQALKVKGGPGAGAGRRR